MALEASDIDGMKVAHRPRLLNENGMSYIAGDFANWREEKGIDHVRGAPLYPQTQGKIEFWHHTFKNQTLLENY
jgi:putative transposase